MPQDPEGHPPPRRDRPRRRTFGSIAARLRMSRASNGRSSSRRRSSTTSDRHSIARSRSSASATISTWWHAARRTRRPRSAPGLSGPFSALLSGRHPSQCQQGDGRHHAVQVLVDPARRDSHHRDMPNDVLMFRKSGVSITMGNASPEVQKQARFSVDVNCTSRARARGGPPIPARSISRPTRAIWLSCLGGAPPAGTVAMSFSWNCCSPIPVRSDDGARTVGAIDGETDADVDFAGSSRRRWCRRRSSAASYGVIDNRSENRSTSQR